MADVAAEVVRLKPIVKRMRERVIRMVTAAGSGHPGGSLSAAEIVATIFFRVLRRKPHDPHWPDRDRFIISKGHGVPIVYAALAELGEIGEDELLTLRQLGSRLQGHPDRIALPWVEAATGSLGQGLSIALGMAMASRFDGDKFRVFCLLGDGETQAGQVWEAAMAAGKYKPANLVAILDYNKVQLDGRVPDIMDLEPLADKWRAFGFHTIEIDGHDLVAVRKAFEEAEATKGKPTCVIAHTIKGKGVSFMENNPKFHGVAPTQDELKLALQELN